MILYPVRNVFITKESGRCDWVKKYPSFGVKNLGLNPSSPRYCLVNFVFVESSFPPCFLIDKMGWLWPNLNNCCVCYMRLSWSLSRAWQAAHAGYLHGAIHSGTELHRSVKPAKGCALVHTDTYAHSGASARPPGCAVISATCVESSFLCKVISPLKWIDKFSVTTTKGPQGTYWEFVKITLKFS